MGIKCFENFPNIGGILSVKESWYSLDLDGYVAAWLNAWG
jgi:hypothetical protein